MQAENVIREKHAGDIEQLKFIFSDENRIIVQHQLDVEKQQQW